MQKRTEMYFSYPPNLQELDLATLVTMYRDRGMPRAAKPGEYFACAVSHELIREAKWWFGLHYSQQAWDRLLTRGSEGYPLTEVELNVLGLVLDAGDEPVNRDFIEEHCGAVSKLAYMIINDLKEFGFLKADDHERIMITPRGEKALQGIAQRIFNKKFSYEMLYLYQDQSQHPPIERTGKKENDQPSLF